MRQFKNYLAENGYKIFYTKLDDKDNLGRFDAELLKFYQQLKPQKIILTEPSEYRVLKLFNDFQQKNNDEIPICALSFNAFFTYIAIQARQKIFDEAIKAQLKTNPHPLDKYRTNCPLARLELFRSLYNIKKGDKMYWPSTDTIW